MRNVVEKVVEKIKTQFTFSKICSKILDLYEIMWKNTVGPERPQITI